MYARSTTLHAEPKSLDTGITYFRDHVLPALRDINGFVGASLIVDRDTGLCIATASWASEEARAASGEQVSAIRQQAATVFGAGSVQVDEWEIAVMHRGRNAPPGACVRATWVRSDPGGIDRAIDLWKLGVLPAMEAVAGFCSASLMVDRTEGRSVGTFTFDSRAALELSRKPAETIRATMIKETGGQVLAVHEFELALAHLDVPEMA